MAPRPTRGGDGAATTNYPLYSSTFSGQQGRLLRVGRGLNCPFRHISDAVNASKPYDRIVIESGEYYEAICIVHPLELASSNDDEVPLISARGPCITINEYGSVLIENLRIIAKGSKVSDSMSIMVVHGKPLIRNCDLSAVQVNNESAPTITHCRINRANYGAGLRLSETAAGTYTHNDICFHPEECVRIHSSGQPTFSNNRVLQTKQSRAVILIAGSGIDPTTCRPIFFENIISGNGEASVEDSLDPAVLLAHAQLIGADVYSAEALVYVSWGARPVLRANYLCNGIHGFLFQGVSLPVDNFSGNRIATCTGWAICINQGTFLSIVNSDVQRCAGAVRVVDSNIPFFDSHIHGKDIPSRKSSPRITSSALSGLMEKESTVDLTNVDAFREELIQSIKDAHTAAGIRSVEDGEDDDGTRALRHINSSRSKEVISTQIIIRECSFRHNYHYGVYIDNSAVGLTDCVFSENMIGLAMKRDCTKCDVQRNRFDGHLIASVLIADVARVVFLNNTIMGASIAALARLLMSRHANRQQILHRYTGISSDHVDAHQAITFFGLCVLGNSELHLRNNNIGGNAFNLFSREFSIIHARENVFHQASESSITLVERCEAELRSNTFKESMGGGVCVDEHSRALIHTNSFMSLGRCGTSSHKRSRVMFLHNTLYSCGEGMAVHDGGIMHSEHNSISLGNTGVVATGKGSDITILHSHFFSSTRNFIHAKGCCIVNVRSTNFECSIGISLVMRNGVAGLVEKCSFVDGRDGIIHVESAGEAPPTHVDITACTFKRSDAAGVVAGPGSAGCITQCSFSYCKQVGLHLLAGARYEIHNNTVEACAGKGIEVLGSSRIHHNQIDGWCDESCENTLIGLRVAAHAKASIHDNHIMDCHIGMAADDEAAATIEDVEVRASVDAGILVNGAATQTIFRRVEINASDAAGIILRNGSRCRFEGCVVVECLQASVVVAHSGPTTLTECSFASTAACEVLGDEDYEMEVESSTRVARLGDSWKGARRPATASTAAGYASRPTTTASAAASPRVADAPPGLTSFLHCTIGGDVSRQGVLALSSSMHVEDCEVHAAHIAHTSDRPVSPFHLNARRKRKQISDAFGKTINHESKSKSRRMEGGVGIYAADGALVEVRNTTIFACPCAGLLLQPGAHARVEHCAITECGVGALLVGTPTILSRIQGEGGGRTGSSGGKRSRRGNAATSTQSLFTGPNITSQVILGRTFTKSECGVYLRHVAVSDCTAAGMLFYVGSAARVDGSSIQKCRDGVVVGEEASIFMEQTTIESSQRHGIHLIGAPQSTSTLTGLRVEHCSGYGVLQLAVPTKNDLLASRSATPDDGGLHSLFDQLHAASSLPQMQSCTTTAPPEPAALVEMITTTSMMSFHGCEFNDNEGGSAMLEGSTRFVDCRFASSEAITGVACHGNGSRSIFSSCHFAHSMKVHLVAEMEACVVLHKCVLESCPHAVVMLEAARLIAQECAMRSCGSAMIYAPSVLSQRKRAKMHVEMCKSPVLAGRVTSPFEHSSTGTYERRAGTTTTTMLVMEACNIHDCEVGVESRTTSLQWQNPNAAVLPEETKKTRLALRTSTPMMCDLRRCVVDGSRNVGVCLDGLCREASLRQCVITACGNGVDLRTSLHAKKVLLEDCQLERSNVGLCIGGGEAVHVRRCTFSEQKEWAVRLVGGEEVVLRDSTFVGNRSGAIVVDVSLHASLNALRTIIDESGGNRKLASGAWRDIFTLCRRWIIKENTFAQTSSGVVVPPLMVPAHARPMLYVYSNSFAHCEYGLLCRPMEDAGSDQKPLHVQECAEEHPEMVALLHETDEPLQTMVLQNLFEDNHYGCYLSGTTTTAHVWSNDFVRNHQSGIYVAEGAAPMVMDNVFEKHGGEAPKEKAAPLMSDAALASLDAHSALRICSGARGHYAHNRFHANQVAVCLDAVGAATPTTSAAEDAPPPWMGLTINDNQFLRNGRGIRLCGDCHADILNNTFMDGFSHDVHISRNGASTSHALLAYNRFVSMQIPVAILVDESAHLQLHRCILSGNADVAVRARPYATCCITESLFLGVGIGIDVEDRAHVYLHNSYLLQHHHRALCCRSKGEAHVERCSIMSYPDHHSIECCADAKLMLQSCFFLSATHVSGALTPIILCSGNVHILSCHMEGRQPGLVIESKTFAEVERSNFYGCDIGIINQTHGNMRALRCFFWMNKLASIKLFEHSNGNVEECMMAEGTITAMGAHHVVMDEARIPASCPFAPTTALTVAECEELLLRRFAELLVESPSWVIEKKQISNNTTGSTQKHESGAVNASQAGDMTTVAGEQDEDDVEEDEDAFVSLQRSYHRSNTGSVADEEEQKKSEEKEGGGGDEAAEREKHAAAVAAAVAAAGAEFVAKTLDGNNHVAEKKKPQPKKLANQPPPPPPPNGKKKKAPQKKPPPLNTPPPLLEAKEVCGRLNHVDPHRMPERIRDALTSWQAREDGEEASEISSAPPRRPARGSSAATTTTTTTTIVATASAECTPSPARGGAPADATKLEEHRLPSLATDVNAILAALQTRRMKQLGDGDIQAGPIPQSLARTASVATSRLESIQQLNRSSIYSSPVPPRGGGRTSPDGLVKLDVAATSSSSPLSKKKAAAATSAAGSPAVAKQWNPNFIHGVKHGELTDAHKKEMEQYAQQQRERRRRRRRHHPLRSVHLQHGEPFMTNPYQRLPTSLPIFIMERVAHGKDYTPVEVHPFPSFDKEYIFLTPNLGYNIFLHDFCYRFGDDHLPAVLPVLMASDSQSPRSRKHRSVSEGGGTTSLCSSMNWTLTPAGTPRQEISGEFTSQYGGGAPGSSYSRKSLHTNNGEGGAWKEGSLSLGSQRTKKSGAESPFAATGGGRMSGDLRGGSSGVLGGSAGTLTSMHGNRDYDGRIGAPSGPTSRNNTGDVLDGLGMDEARRARRDSTGRGGKNRSRSLLDMDLSGLSATDGGSPGHRGCGAAGDARRGGPGGGISGSGSGSGGVGGRDGSVPKKGKGKKKGGVGSKSSKRGASKTKKRGGSRGDAMGDATSSTNDARGKQGISSTEFGDADDENAVAAKKRNAHTAEGGHFGSIIGGSDGGDPLDGSPVRGGASFASSSFRPDISSTTNPPSRGAGTAMGSSSTHGMSVPRGSGGSASPPGSGHGRGDGDGDGAGGWSSLEGRLGSSNERAGVKGSGDATLSRGVSGPELAFMGTNYSDTSTTSALPQLTVSSLAFANTLGSKPEVQHKNLQSIIDSVLREEEEEEDSRNGRGTRDEDAYGSSRGSRHFRDEINAAGHTSRIDSSARRSRRLGDGDDDAETSHDSIPAAPLVDFSTLELDEEAMKAVSVLKRVGNREFEDVLAILHWLAERRARMKKEKYVRVIDEIFDESKLCFFRPPPPSPHSDSGVVIPFPPTPNSRGSMARLLSRSSGRPTSMYSRLHPSMSGSMPTTKQDEINVEVVDAEGEDAEMIYIPFPAMDAATDGAAASSEAAHHRAADTPMLAVRMVSGIGITEVRVVHMEAEEIPLHAANYSDSRSRRTLLEHLGTHHPEHLPELRQALPTHDLPPTMAAMHARPNSRAASRSSAPSGSPTSPAPRSMSYEELQHHLQNNASRLAYASTALPHFVADSRVLRTEHSLKRRPLSPLKYLPASALQHHKLQKVAPRLTFDPADPSKTTPFATDNRPLTYNAMGLMKWE